MDRLWAPWRIKYINGKKTKKCIFCEGVKQNPGNYTILKTKYSIVLLNAFPYNNGHLMVSPVRHVADLSLLKEAEILDLVKTLNKAQELLCKALRPAGFNIGINLSRAAGAGIVSHLHIHMVPRWIGDTNFMPVFHETKIIPQSLDELFKRLKKEIEREK